MATWSWACHTTTCCAHTCSAEYLGTGMRCTCSTVQQAYEATVVYVVVCHPPTSQPTCPPAQPASNRPGGHLKLDLTMQCTSHSYEYGTILWVWCTLNLVSICLPRGYVLLLSRSISRLAGSGSILSLDSHIGHAERQDDTATFQCPPLLCGRC